MRILSKVTRPLGVMLASALCTLQVANAQTPPSISDVPLFLNSAVPPLNMIVLGRDHKLYYEAYNDASDLNGDGVLDVKYKPEIDYFGYFDSFKCYAHDGARFNPTRTTANKRCTVVDSEWSGDFLNYLTTARIDALRKVFYGGYRSTDTGSLTVLERSHIPQDAHSWGKEYTSVAVDLYNIADYTPLPVPAAGTRHLFANTTPLPGSGSYAFTEAPLLRVLRNQTVRVWNWLSIERPVAGTQVVTGVTAGGSEIRSNVTPEDYIVRVQVCASAALAETNCRQYGSSRKPIGLLQEYGENDSMYFGLLSGSYAKNTSGGVLRRTVGSIQDEVNVGTNGTFKNFEGIIATLNRLRSTGFGGNYEYTQNTAPGVCGWITTRAINPGDCQMWGNPVAEMMYETLRYFGGRGSPTGAFATTAGQGQEGLLAGIGGLPVANWDNPLASRPFCSKPFQTVVSDINPSYDSDALPGSSFPGTPPSDTLDGLDVSALGQQIWDDEMVGAANVFIGQSGAVADGAPTPKTASSFGNIRGLAPEEPTKLGSYYSASVAYHGRTTEVGALNSSAADSEENVNTFAVALASPLPRIDIPVAGRKITLVPFAKSVGGSGINAAQGQFQPTNQIVDFYVDSLGPTSGSFRVNFEDVEQGADHDMDAIVRYTYTVTGGTVNVTVDSDYAAGGILHHLGYIVSGSTADGTYLVVRDRDTAAGSDPDYFLDTPPGFSGTPPGSVSEWDDNTALPLSNTRTFTPGSGSAATLLKDPLWYAAKWGGFEDTNDNDKPDVAAEWDSNGDGNPDNYFLVTNALNLGQQLASAFDEILSRTGSASSASVNSGSISSDTRLYQAKFNSGDWSGQLLSFRVNTDGSLATPAEWEASAEIPAHLSRKIITVNSNGTTGVPFRWANLDATRRGQLGAAPNAVRQQRLNWLRGDITREDQEISDNSTPQFRNRPKTPTRNVLGDIVSSAPMFVGKPPFLYPDIFPGGTETPYSTFVATHDASAPDPRPHMVYAGANDGMLHAFDAETGEETLAFIPGQVFPNLHHLTTPTYSHRYYVDGPPTMGDAFFGGAWHTVLVGGLNKGGKSVYALDITDPSTFTEGNADNIFLWEFTDSATPADMGFTYSRPAIVRLQNGKWAAVFGNGYNSTNGKAVLYIVDIANGSIIRKINTNVGTGGGNGLSTPALVDMNGDSIVDLAYAGDLAGNLWKFSLAGNNPLAWDVAYKSGTTNLPLFTARDAANNPQPITSRPEVGRGPNGAGTIVLFGTGRYLGVPDKTPTQTQTFYGIRDPHTMLSGTDRIGDRGDLTSQQIIHEGTETFTTDDGSTVSASIRVTTNHVVSNRGWYLDLLQPPNPPGTFQGEMQVSDSILRNGRIIFTTVIPDPDPCTVGGTSWLMELDAISGSRLTVSPFDLNRDIEFDGEDFVEITLDDGTIIEVPVSGLQSEVGITPKPGVLAGPNAEYKYTPGTTGNIQVTVENPGINATGRQSWRQIR
jgi:type IV pilus assembly protein PilY1